MHTKLESLLSKLLKALEEMTYYFVVHTGPGVIRSVLGLVGPVPVYCDWVRWKVWSATSTSVWQHVKLSEHIRP